MKTYLECMPCFFKQVLEAARLSGANNRIQKRILDEVALKNVKTILYLADNAGVCRR